MTRHILPLLAAVALWAAPIAAPAQGLDDASARLQLAGEYIGVHTRLYAIGQRCNYQMERIYGPEAALQTLSPLMTASEVNTLEAFLDSREFLQNQQVIGADIKQGWQALRSDDGLSADKACVTLLERAIRQFKDVEARLGRLH